MDDNFEPRLGHLRSRDGSAGRSYLQRVLHAQARAGGRKPGRKGFNGSRIGRGAVAGRLLGSRDRFSAYRQRRVVVKSRIIRINIPNGINAARAHMRYIQRDGVTREGEPGRLYAAEQDKVDGRAVLDRQTDDRHQFRFIVSPEDGSEYPDLKDLTRRLMTQMEQDVGTKLDWAAVDHFNTGHPHIHIVVRGKTDQGKDLVIAPEYLTSGMRERAMELVSLDLGPRTDRQIEERLRREVGQERLTSIDRRLLRDMGADRIVNAAHGDPLFQTLRAGRLKKLSALGLAEHRGAGRWTLAEGMDDTLRRMGERGDIIRTMQRAWTAHSLERAPADMVIADSATMTPIVGRLVERGLSDELNDRHYLLVDGIDGAIHYVDIGKGDRIELIPDGAVVRLAPRPTEARAVDRTVAEIAEANGGRYSVELHLRHDPSATQSFAETHVRRLEAMRKAGHGVEREADGSWTVAPDHVARASAFEASRARFAPVVVDTLSTLPLEQQVQADGATWLDRELASGNPEAVRDAGFGAEVTAAKAQRQRWLVDQELADDEQGRIVLRANLLTRLRQRELRRVAGQLSKETGLGYVETKTGDRVQGLYKRPVELASGRCALIEKSREFTLVPWRPVLDRHLDRPVSGIMKGGRVNWTIGRGRGGPSVS